jgi:transposase
VRLYLLDVTMPVAGLEDWMRAERAKLSRHAAVAKTIDYTLTRWGAFTRFLHDGRICLTNNAAERALRGLALGRKCGCLLVQSAGRSGRP